tara:strand:+ start:374 stop:928 length:555 start_codon:yes stop_codon:yes gene_type:complete
MELFPIPIHSEELNLNVKAMAKYCLAMKKTTKSVNVSNKGGWQSPHLTGEHPPFNDLFKAISMAAEQYRKRIAYKDPLKIDTVWININGYKDYNIEHTHLHTIASGSFYLKPNNSNILFIHPASDIMESQWQSHMVDEYNRYNSAVWNIKPTQNQLLMFPGWVRHRVEPNLGKGDRISISFNLN